MHSTTNMLHDRDYVKRSPFGGPKHLSSEEMQHSTKFYAVGRGSESFAPNALASQSYEIRRQGSSSSNNLAADQSWQQPRTGRSDLPSNGRLG